MRAALAALFDADGEEDDVDDEVIDVISPGACGHLLECIKCRALSHAVCTPGQAARAGDILRTSHRRRTTRVERAAVVAPASSLFSVSALGKDTDSPGPLRVRSDL